MNVKGYHAHVYYDGASKERAARLRERLAQRFSVTLGRWHDAPVGPHPHASYQVAFAPPLFGDLVPWLALNRDGLTVLVHPETGDEVADHTAHAMWMGEMPALDLSALR